MWTPQDVARELCQSRAEGLDADRIREAIAQERAFGAAADGPLSPEAREARAAKAEEWDRILTLPAVRGLDVYRVADDPDATAWAADRATRKHFWLARHAQWRQDQRDQDHGLPVHLHLGEAAGQRLRSLAAGAGVSAERLLVLLAARARADTDGTVSVPAFHPSGAATAPYEPAAPAAVERPYVRPTRYR
ncbi:hypothetical protein ABT160_30085 [Streptomyces sp. NPDC001941]|uniref:hypothetical protein n=1 Tax=Streptomyces sp. NPDC001941 TaxID=3154659 RepID=UPI00332E43C7